MSKWQHELAIKPPAVSPETWQAFCSTPLTFGAGWREGTQALKISYTKLIQGSPPSCYVASLRATTINHIACSVMSGWNHLTYTTSQCLIPHLYVILLIVCALLVRVVWMICVIFKPHSSSNTWVSLDSGKSPPKGFCIAIIYKNFWNVMFLGHQQKQRCAGKAWRNWITGVWGQWSTRNWYMVLTSK